MEWLGIPGLQPDWSTQTQNSSVLVSTTGSYQMGTEVKGPGKAGGRGGGGHCWLEGLLGKPYQELAFTCASVGCYLSHAFWEALMSVQGP